MTKINPLFPKENISITSHFLLTCTPVRCGFLGIEETKLVFGKSQNKTNCGLENLTNTSCYTLSQKKTFSFKNKSLALQMKIVWIFVESSTKKARCLLLKALQKQDVFRWKLYKSRMSCIEIGNFSTWQIFAPQIP